MPRINLKNGQIVAKDIREKVAQMVHAYNDRLVPIIKIYDNGKQLSDSDLSFNIAATGNFA